MHGAVLGNAAVGEDEQPLGNAGEWIVRVAHDERAVQPHADLITGLVIGVRVIPVRPGASRQQPEDIVVRRTGRDRIERAPIGRRWNVQAVPVDGGRHGELVAQVDDDAVTLAELQHGTGHGAVVGEHVGGLSREEGQPGGGRRERQLDDARTRSGCGRLPIRGRRRRDQRKRRDRRAGEHDGGG